MMPELGRKQTQFRHRGHPSAYPNEGPVKVEDAYDELTHHAFAVWMRLMVASEPELRLGRMKLTRLLGYSHSRGNYVLLELRRKGYITWLTRPGMPSHCVVNRRALISARTQFVRLSRMFGETCVGPAEASCSVGTLRFGHSRRKMRQLSQSFPRLGPTKNCQQVVRKKCHSVFFPHSLYILSQVSTYSFPSLNVFFPNGISTQWSEYAPVFSHCEPSNTKSGNLGENTIGAPHCGLPIAGGQLDFVRSLFRTSQEAVSKHKFVSETAYFRTPSGTYIRERFRERILVEKARAKGVQDVAKRSLGRAKQRRGNVDASIDFSSLDQRGDPAISFDPDSPLRERMMELLSRPNRDPDRRKLMLKLGVEYSRIYTRYRRAAEQELGIRPSIFAYDVPEAERAYAAEAGQWCVLKGVTPREVLEYWHTHIRTFADKRMKIPPLSLMKSPGMVDQVACARVAPDVPARRTKSDKKDLDPRPPSRNSFSDASGLDRRLRRGLERAGFDTRDYNDRFLMTLQQLSQGRAAGQKVFISSKLFPMVDWAVKNLYASDAG